LSFVLVAVVVVVVSVIIRAIIPWQSYLSVWLKS